MLLFQAMTQHCSLCAAHVPKFGLETVDYEVMENNSDILADTTYVLRVRLKDEWGCDIDCSPLKEAAQQHLTLHTHWPKLKMLCVGSAGAGGGGGVCNSMDEEPTHAKSLHPRFLT